MTKRNHAVYTIILNRPDVHNAMSELLMRELADCFKKIYSTKDIRTVVLTGEGKSFCAGADLKWMKSMVTYSKQENIRDSELLLDLYETIYNCPKPVIGCINGHAFGGGIGLIAVCDITIGIPSSIFAFSEVNLGIIPSVISTYIAPRMQLASMRRYFITGERFGTVTAQNLGLIDIICEPQELDNTIQKYIEILSSSGPQAINEVKQLLRNLQIKDQTSFKKFTVEKIADLRISSEGQEGINAFLEKRKPNWRED
jgi:methylglutaconyl-CoA hydratase